MLRQTNQSPKGAQPPEYGEVKMRYAPIPMSRARTCLRTALIVSTLLMLPALLVLPKTHTELLRSLVRDVSSLQERLGDGDAKNREEIALLRGSIESAAQRQQQQEQQQQASLQERVGDGDAKTRELIALLRGSIESVSQWQQQQEQQQQVPAPKLPARSTPIHTNYHEFSTTLHGVTFKYLTTDRGHQRSIADHLQREKEGYVILKGAVTEHKDPSPAFVMDIGSNHGLYALFAATIGADVIALEPQKKYFEVVQAAARLNGVEFHVQVYNYGALDAREIVTMADHQVNEGGIGHLVVGGKTADNPTAVETRFIDDFMPHNPRRAVDLLKVDVEGFEIKALRSAKKLFGDCKGRVRNVLVEFGPPSRWERSGNSAADGATLLREMRDNYGFEPRITTSYALEPFRSLVPGGGEKKLAYGATYVAVSGDSEIDMLVEAMRRCDCEAYVWFASTVVFEPDKSV